MLLWKQFGVAISLLLILHGSLAMHLIWIRKKPHIASRSPLLIVMVIIGVFLDSSSTLVVRTLSASYIEMICQASLVQRSVIHWMIILFIIYRIQRVKRVTMIQMDILKFKREIQKKKDEIEASVQYSENDNSLK